MTQIELIQTMQRLAQQDKRVFTLREVATFAGVSRPAAGMTLLRAEKKEIVSRTANEWINLMDPPKLEEVALSIASPSYISFESALYHHGIISQSPRGYLSVAVSGRPKEFTTPLGKIRLIHLQSSLFFGFNTDRIAFPEKAWLDLLYIRGRQGRKEIISEEVYYNRLDRKRLNSFAKKFPPWVKELNRELAKIMNW